MKKSYIIMRIQKLSGKITFIIKNLSITKSCRLKINLVVSISKEKKSKTDNFRILKKMRIKLIRNISWGQWIQAKTLFFKKGVIRIIRKFIKISHLIIIEIRKDINLHKINCLEIISMVNLIDHNKLQRMRLFLCNKTHSQKIINKNLVMDLKILVKIFNQKEIRYLPIKIKLIFTKIKNIKFISLNLFN